MYWYVCECNMSSIMGTWYFIFPVYMYITNKVFSQDYNKSENMDRKNQTIDFKK